MHIDQPAWDALKKLKAGLMKTRPAPPLKMKKADGTRCTTPEQNADVFKCHFEKLYGRRGMFDYHWSLHFEHALKQVRELECQPPGTDP